MKKFMVILILVILVVASLYCVAPQAKAIDPKTPQQWLCYPKIQYSITTNTMGVSVSANAYNLCDANTNPLIVKCFFYNGTEEVGTQTQEGDLNQFVFTCTEPYTYYYIIFNITCSACGMSSQCSDGGSYP